MAGVTLTPDGLDAALNQARAGIGVFGHAELFDGIGALLESSTRERFETKTGPDGQAWPEWSEEYALDREAHHSLLVGEGDFQDSNQFYAGANEVGVGSNLVYAAIHQMGGEEVGMNIPARPYLGLSDEDRSAISALIEDEFGRALQ